KVAANFRLVCYRFTCADWLPYRQMQMARRGWFVPGFTHGEDNKLVGDLRKIGKAYRRQFQAALRAPSGEIVDPKGDFLYVYLDEENYKKCREKNVLVPNAGDGVLATALEPHSESYTYRQVREQLQAFCGDGVINYAANELSCSYFLMIQASNEFEEVGAIQDGPGVTKAVWKRNVQHAGELLPYDLIAVGRSSFLPEAALDPPDPDD
ncbi:RolB family protein, partial [Agrobacterium vitis]